MVIDEKTYSLSSNNYIQVKTDKDKIVLGNTFNSDMKHVIGWKTRLNGNYKKTAHFTIAKNGSIYRHINPNYYSHYFNSHETNIKSIIILLENYGWLIKNENNEFINLLGNIYEEPRDVYEKKWRGFMYWAQYTREQLNSAVYLVKKLCETYNVTNKVIAHNTKIDINKAPYGVFYKSNLEPFYTDVNPNWYFEDFKTLLENYE